MLDETGGTESFPFLIDTGADRTLLSYEAVAHLGAEVETADGPVLEGVGGSTPSVALRATFWLLNTDGAPTPLGGPLLGRPYPVGDNLCILGRDLLTHFAVIVDRPGGVVCLLHGRHRYVIQET
ncbi:MAG: retropepsin-like domain-containing protein [Gemmataceae bacterium]|nr:retropepsin-like domain-containing protein [Gemmataceae bacterium]